MCFNFLFKESIIECIDTTFTSGYVSPLRYSDPSGQSFSDFLHFWFHTDTGYELQKFFFMLAIRVKKVEGNERKFAGIVMCLLLLI